MFGNGLTTKSIARFGLSEACQPSQAVPQLRDTETIVRPKQISTRSNETYILDELLSGGGFGSVYRARRQSDNLTVALKLPKNGNSDAQDHLESEISALQSLSHPHMIKMIDCGYTCASEPFLALELVEGPNLQELLNKSSRLSLVRAARIGLQIAEALEYIHDAGFIHNDLKPSNIIIDSGNIVRVLDFGITSRAKEHQQARGSELSATLLYMSPEQMTGLPTSPRSDIYQLGLILFRCLTGRMPFENSLESLLGFRLVGSSVARLELDELSRRSPRFAALIDKALCPKTADRIISAQTLVNQLRALVDENDWSIGQRAAA